MLLPALEICARPRRGLIRHAEPHPQAFAQQLSDSWYHPREVVADVFQDGCILDLRWRQQSLGSIYR